MAAAPATGRFLLRRLLLNRSGLLLSRSSSNSSASLPPTSISQQRYEFSGRFSFSSGSGEEISDEEQRRRINNRLLYRSKQRGFLELDLVLGQWVEQNIHSLDQSQIKALVEVLDVENPDLWKWLTGQGQPPESFKANPVFSALQSKILNNLDKHASPGTRASPGQSWVRGWDDKRGMEGPHYGNQ